MCTKVCREKHLCFISQSQSDHSQKYIEVLYATGTVQVFVPQNGSYEECDQTHVR